MILNLFLNITSPQIRHFDTSLRHLSLRHQLQLKFVTSTRHFDFPRMNMRLSRGPFVQVTGVCRSDWNPFKSCNSLPNFNFSSVQGKTEPTCWPDSRPKKLIDMKRTCQFQNSLCKMFVFRKKSLILARKNNQFYFS